MTASPPPRPDGARYAVASTFDAGAWTDLDADGMAMCRKSFTFDMGAWTDSDADGMAMCRKSSTFDMDARTPRADRLPCRERPVPGLGGAEPRDVGP